VGAAATAVGGIVGVGNNEDMVTEMMEEGDERPDGNKERSDGESEEGRGISR